MKLWNKIPMPVKVIGIPLLAVLLIAIIYFGLALMIVFGVITLAFLPFYKPVNHERRRRK